jgi:hypothetical protein
VSRTDRQIGDWKLLNRRKVDHGEVESKRSKEVTGANQGQQAVMKRGITDNSGGSVLGVR